MELDDNVVNFCVASVLENVGIKFESVRIHQRSCQGSAKYIPKLAVHRIGPITWAAGDLDDFVHQRLNTDHSQQEQTGNKLNMDVGPHQKQRWNNPEQSRICLAPRRDQNVKFCQK